MDKLQSQATMFANRLSKRVQYYRKWAKKQNLTAYRIYDRDIPEIPLCVDYYGFVDDSGGITDHYACMAFFERPYEKDPREEDIWLDLMREQVVNVLGIQRDHVLFKMRRRQKGSDQYEKTKSAKSISGVVREGDLLFGVNLSDYLDTGLFLDHRPLRQMLTKTAKDKRVLNLFGYTGALSVAAARGGASLVQTVDLSNTYLDWAGLNLELNGFEDSRQYPRTRFDVVEFLKLEVRKISSGTKSGFDLILLDPPTFSNSKKTEDVLDTNKQWPSLVRDCLSLLNPGGILYFSTNSRKLSFEADLLPASIRGQKLHIEDMTEWSIPEDFKKHRIHRCWKLSLEQV
ncbi:MAG: class I SAM-dependent methyltransferase [Proteobacteria bacterium]|nr:class I SAM-dependent methyltransferase [Pseudomonadota bacterium]